jgi:6-phosphogluconolactonase
MSRAAALLAALALTATVAAEEAPKKLMVYFGTYTGQPKGPKSEGIYRAELDLATGKLSEPVLAGKATHPSFLAIHPKGKFLYAVGEVAAVGKKRGGGVSAFAIDDKGDLKLLNQESSKGGGPCHIVTDKAGTYVFAANYGGGSAVALPVGKDGKVGEATGFVQHKGKSVDKGRQEAPHAHSINLDAGGKFAFVADLGLDKVLIYKVEDGKLVPNDPPSVSVPAGGGPRHFAFHPTGKFAYTNNELTSTVSAMSYDADKGELKVLQTISTLPKPHKGNSTAEVVVHPTGKFVYVSNRGHNSIAVFTVDEKTGKLTAAGHATKGINVPRNFAVGPTGKWCLVANQAGNDVIVFKIDAKTGALSPTESRIEIAAPVCVRMMPWPRAGG